MQDGELKAEDALGGSYEVLQNRLAEQGRQLGQAAQALNEARREQFGSSGFEQQESILLRTENNCIPIDIINCDTDQIIPARFLRKDRKDPEMHTFLWHDLRRDPAFIFNKAPYNEGKVVVADVNWGCGSSREGAVYALNANGIRAVVAPSFGDIHYNNCLKWGVF